MSEKKLTFEQALARLDEIVRELERGSDPLEESLKLFEEGSKLMKYCSSALDKAEQKVTILLRDSQGAVTEELFEEEKNDAE